MGLRGLVGYEFIGAVIPVIGRLGGVGQRGLDNCRQSGPGDTPTILSEEYAVGYSRGIALIIDPTPF